MNNKTIFTILTGLAFAAIAILVIYPVQDFDIFWHVANGRAMVTQHRIVNEEIFSYTAAGNPFHNHAWLAQIFFYLCYAAAGANGLIAAKLALTLAICGLLYAFARRRGLDNVTAAGLCLGVIIASLFRYVVRPHLFSHLLLTALGALLFSRPHAKTTRRLFILLPAIMLVWDVLHGAIYGVVLAGAFFAGETINALMAKRQTRRLPPSYPILAGALVLTAALMLISPYGPRTYDIFVQFVNGTNAMTAMTAEFQPTVIGEQPAFAALMILAWGLAVLRGRKTDLATVFVLIPFTYLSLRYVRVIGPASLVAGLTIAVNLGALVKERQIAKPMQGVAAALILAGCLFTGYHKFMPPPKYDSFGTGLSADAFPVGSTRFVKAVNLTGNLYNTDRYGGYLSFFLTPERKIFHYNHHMLFSALENFVHHPESRAKWHINYAIIGRADEWDMFTRDGFVPIYWEPTAAVMIKDSPQNAAIIRRYRIHYFSPLMSDQDFAAQAANQFIRPTLLRETATYLRFRRDPRLARDLAAAIGAKPPLAPDLSRSLAETALGGNPYAPALLDIAGRLAYRAGDLTVAERRLRAAIAYAPKQTTARLALAYLLYDRKEDQEAARQFEVILKQAPNQPDAIYGLALTRYRLGDNRRAAELWRRYLEIVPKGRWADEARRYLAGLPGGDRPHHGDFPR